MFIKGGLWGVLKDFRPHSKPDRPGHVLFTQTGVATGSGPTGGSGWTEEPQEL